MTGSAVHDRPTTAPYALPVRTGTLRPLLLRLHFYAGVLVAPFIFVAAVTGGLYALSTPIEGVVYGHLLEVDPVSDAMPLSEQVAAAQRVSDVPVLVGVRPAPGPEGTTRVLFDDGTLEESVAHAVFVHPGTGEVLGQEPVYGTSGSLPQRAWIDHLHRSLHLGEAGRAYSELAASWLWVVALGGLVLWSGRRRRRPDRDAVLPDRAARGRARTRSQHGVLGVWLLVGLLVLSATGLTWSRWAGTNITDLRSGLGWQTPTVTTDLAVSTASDPADVDRVLAAARAAGLTSDQVEVRLPVADGQAWTATEVHRAYPTQVDAVAVSPTTFEVVDEARFADYPVMAKLARWGVDVHMGTLFGLPNQLALAALAFGLAVQVVLGYRLWWQRRPSAAGSFAVGPPAARGAWRSAPLPALAGLAAVTVAVSWFLPLLGASLAAFLVLDTVLGVRARRRRAPAVPAQRIDAGTARLVLTAAAAAVLGAAAVLVATGLDERPGEGSPEVGFARDMQVHHAQAVAMASMALDRSSDDEVLAMALDMVQTQQAQIGMMHGWLSTWEVPRYGDDEAMAWMGHPVDGLMPGMATPEQMGRLAAARGPAFDLLFVQLMHAHHSAGLPMAQAVLDASDVQPVVELATSIRDSQSAELTTLDAIALRVSGGTTDAGGEDVGQHTGGHTGHG